MDAAIWETELAIGNGSERIYLVEPTRPSKEQVKTMEDGLEELKEQEINALND